MVELLKECGLVVAVAAALLVIVMSWSQHRRDRIRLPERRPADTHRR